MICRRTRRIYEHFCSQKQSITFCQLFSFACNQILIEKFHANNVLLIVYSFVNQTVRYSLSELREKSTLEISRMSIDKTTIQIFNFFEENRINSKVFIEIQKANNMNLYALSWSKLIRFFFELLANFDVCVILIERYLNLQSKIDHFFRKIKQLIETLHAINELDLNFVKCLNVLEIEFESNSSANNNTSIRILRLHAQEFIQAIDSFFITLMRYHWQNFSFDNFIVDFVALHILNEQNAWIFAQNFSSRFSDWIHCMQLWFLFYCLRKKQSFNFEDEKLQNIVRRECQHYLINTCSNSVVELSFWRLFIWIVNNEIVRHSIITMNDDCTQVNHATIIMNIEKWRAEILTVVLGGFLKKTSVR